MSQGNIKATLYDHMGDDLSVVDAARVSFSKASEWLMECTAWDGKPEGEGWQFMDEDCEDSTMFWKKLKDSDAKLIRFLAEHKHEIPFAHTAITLRCEAPIPIRTQCFKHKVGFVENEESRRYVSYTPSVYVPAALRKASEDKKQGSGGKHEESEYWLGAYEHHTKAAVDFYEKMIEAGVCPEQARLVLPQGVTVNWMWTGSLLAYARFYNLRSKPDAQYEVQLMAAEIDKIIRPLFPVAWSALVG